MKCILKGLNNFCTEQGEKNTHRRLIFVYGKNKAHSPNVIKLLGTRQKINYSDLLFLYYHHACKKA